MRKTLLSTSKNDREPRTNNWKRNSADVREQIRTGPLELTVRIIMQIMYMKHNEIKECLINKPV